MPELPEVETIKNNLQEILPLRIKELEIRREDILRCRDYALEELTGQIIEEAYRRGKYLTWPWTTGLFLVFHLGMGGTLIYKRKETTCSITEDAMCLTNSEDGDIVLTPDRRY